MIVKKIMHTFINTIKLGVKKSVFERLRYRYISISVFFIVIIFKLRLK